MRTIALEEHFWTPRLAAAPGTGPLAAWGPRVGEQLADLAGARLAEMDAAGIDVQVISHVAPAAQGIAGSSGLARAREANDQLAAAVRAHPDRFGAFAAMPTADVAAAAAELTRAVRDLGFAGGIVHSTFGTDGAFLDDPRFGELLARFEELDVPLLAKVPLTMTLREQSDGGLPVVLADPDDPAAQALAHAARGLIALTPVELPVMQPVEPPSGAPKPVGMSLPMA